MPKKRGTRSGTRSGLRREIRVVTATALRKLRGSKVSLSKHESEVLAQPEQEQLQALTAQAQQLTGVMMDMDRRHAQEIQ